MMKLEVNSMIAPYLYRADGTLSCIDMYISDLMQQNDAKSIEHAKKLLEYRDIITNTQFLQQLKETFDGFYTFIVRNYPELRFVLEGRRKSLTSLDDKIIKVQSNGGSPENIRDLMAFRLILLNKEPKEKLKLIYSIADSIIEFFRGQGFVPYPAGKVKDTRDYDPQLHPEIVVPVSALSKKNRGFVKDYVANPKSNGYQSLHLVFYDRMSDHFFEVQIRTLTMHAASESGDAGHEAFKIDSRKSIKTTEVDLRKIKMEGLVVSKSHPDGYLDAIGLFKSTNVLIRHKTFTDSSVPMMK